MKWDPYHFLLGGFGWFSLYGSFMKYTVCVFMMSCLFPIKRSKHQLAYEVGNGG